MLWLWNSIPLTNLPIEAKFQHPYFIDILILNFIQVIQEIVLRDLGFNIWTNMFDRPLFLKQHAWSYISYLKLRIYFPQDRRKNYTLVMLPN